MLGSPTPRGMFDGMKTNLFLAILAAGVGGALADSDGQPAPTNLGQAAYPRIAVDGRVTFRLQAPNAGHVRLEGGAGLVKEPLALAKDDQGVWSVTTPPTVLVMRPALPSQL